MVFFSGIWSQVLNSTNFYSSVKDKSISLLYLPFFYIAATQSNKNYTELNGWKFSSPDKLQDTRIQLVEVCYSV